MKLKNRVVAYIVGISMIICGLMGPVINGWAAAGDVNASELTMIENNIERRSLDSGGGGKTAYLTGKLANVPVTTSGSITVTATFRDDGSTINPTLSGSTSTLTDTDTDNTKGFKIPISVTKDNATIGEYILKELTIKVGDGSPVAVGITGTNSDYKITITEGNPEGDPTDNDIPYFDTLTAKSLSESGFYEPGTYIEVSAVEKQNTNYYPINKGVYALIQKLNGTEVTGWVELTQDSNNRLSYSGRIRIPTTAKNGYYKVVVRGSYSETDPQYFVRLLDIEVTGGEDEEDPELPDPYLNYLTVYGGNNNVISEGERVSAQATVQDNNGIERIDAVFSNGKKSLTIALKPDSSGNFTGSHAVVHTTDWGRYTYSYAILRKGNVEVVRDRATDTLATGNHSFTITEPVHRYETRWTTDTAGHWHKANCGHEGTTGYAIHSWSSWTVVKEATPTAYGERRRSCIVCGYVQTDFPAYNQTQQDELNTIANNAVINSINTAASGAVITVDYTVMPVVSSTVFDALRNPLNKNKTLRLMSSGGTTWVFKGSDIVNASKNINLNVGVVPLGSYTGDAKQIITTLIGNRPTVVLNFANNGVLPGKATVYVPVSAGMINSIGRTGLYAYYVNRNTGALELLASNVSISADNTVALPMLHNSTFILTQGAVTTASNINPNTTVTPKPNNTTNVLQKPQSTVVNRIQRVVSPKTSDVFPTYAWVLMLLCGSILVIAATVMKPKQERIK